MSEQEHERIAPEGTAGYPPKFPLNPTENRTVFLKGLYSIILYLGIGYLLLRRWDLLLVIFGVVLLHEAGHFIAMKYYRYADVSMLFLPFIGAFVKGSKKEISQRQSAVILLAGPLPGVLLGVVIHFISKDHPSWYIDGVPLQLIAQLLIWANLLNLLPVYPLDGGQLFNRVFLKEEGILSNIFIFISAAITAFIAFISRFYILLILPVMLIYRFFAGRSSGRLEKEIEESGININKTYQELSDKDYWDIRSVVVRHTPALQHIPVSAPYHYHEKEDKIAAEVDNTLQRNLLLDISLNGKILTVIIWAAALALPWLFNIEFLLLKYLVR
ncbi:site-2 protease family protein [Niabella aquatica]